MSLQNKSSYDEIKNKVSLYSALYSLGQKINLLHEIYTESSAALDFNVNFDLDLDTSVNLRRIKSISRELLKTLLDVKTDEEVFAFVRAMQKMQKYDPRYLPEKKPIEIFAIDKISPALSKAQYAIARLALLNFLLTNKRIMPVREASRTYDARHNILMLDHEARQRYRVFIKGGLFYKEIKIDRFSAKESLVFCDTMSMSSHRNPYRAAYVIDTRGEIYIFTHKEGSLRHSSMMAGNCVFAAGEMVIIDGKLTRITTHSGHYQPGMENMYMVLKYLQRQGVRLENVKIEDVCDLEYYDETADERHFINKETKIMTKVFLAPNNILSVEFNVLDLLAWGDELHLDKMPSPHRIMFSLNLRLKNEIDVLIVDLLKIKETIDAPIVAADEVKEGRPNNCLLQVVQRLSLDDIIAQLKLLKNKTKQAIIELLKQNNLSNSSVDVLKTQIKQDLSRQITDIEDKYIGGDNKQQIVDRLKETEEKLKP